MASLDSLPPDQRAVLQLVLQRGRSYDEIAKLLSIDRTAVRQRALAALDALGPETGVAPEQRALITDYLLRQLPPRVSDETREHLAESGSDRAWARVVASELAPLASTPLPEIPAGAARREPAPDPAPSTRRMAREQAAIATADRPAPGRDGRREVGPDAIGLPGAPPPHDRRSSRRGGALLLGLGSVAAIAIIAVIVILVASGGSSNKNPPTTSGNAASTTAATTGTTGSTTATKVIGQINLTAPGGSSSKAAGIAELVKQGTKNGVVIVAQGVPPNTTHNAYAVWLYSAPSTAQLLGFVNPGVGSNGRLSTTGPLPTSTSQYKQLLVTLETRARPKQPGRIVLQGALTAVP